VEFLDLLGQSAQALVFLSPPSTPTAQLNLLAGGGPNGFRSLQAVFLVKNNLAFEFISVVFFHCFKIFSRAFLSPRNPFFSQALSNQHSIERIFRQPAAKFSRRRFVLLPRSTEGCKPRASSITPSLAFITHVVSWRAVHQLACEIAVIVGYIFLSGRALTR